MGQEVDVLVDAHLVKGYHAIAFDASELTNRATSIGSGMVTQLSPTRWFS
jgi:hypothetical protein